MTLIRLTSNFDGLVLYGVSYFLLQSEINCFLELK